MPLGAKGPLISRRFPISLPRPTPAFSPTTPPQIATSSEPNPSPNPTRQMLLRASAAASSSSSSFAAAATAKKRGNYNCGRCGLPKKGHVCSATSGDPNPAKAAATNTSSAASPPLPPHGLLRRRAFSFDEAVTDESAPGPVVGTGEEEEVDGVLPRSVLVYVLRMLPPKGLVAAAGVSKGWRECVKRVWRSAEELRLRVTRRSQIGFVGSVLQKCSSLVRLSLRVESVLDSTVLACIAFSCTSLEKLEISTADTVFNRITGDELSHFVAEKRCLSALKLEGCSNLGHLNLCSSSLSILCLSDLYCISKMVINCPNLKELSFDFSRQENDSTNLSLMMDSVGRSCPHLQNFHVASTRLSNAAVLALAGANLRGLRMLSLILGSKISDASVAAIVQSYMDLELLDLSGSSISDSGIGMICNVLSDTLTRLLLALCPHITSSGIQFATAQLPHLQLIDCGMSMCDVSPQHENVEERGLKNGDDIKKTENGQKLLCSQPQSMYQKLIIKHGRLKKLSLWGCSGLDALYLNCPELSDLNLNSCTNLHPERLLLQCPTLEMVHASGCPLALIESIQNQISNDAASEGSHFPSKRLADGSKRIQVPHFLLQQPLDDYKKRKVSQRAHCTVQC